MSEEMPVSAYFPAPQAEAVQQAEAETPAAQPTQPEPSPEQARAVEAVFAQQQESRVVAGMLGLWTGALVLHDLAVEAFRTPAEEEQPKRKKKDKDEPEEPAS